MRNRVLDPRGRQRVNSVALHLNLTRERLAPGWVLLHRAGKWRRPSDPLCQRRAHIDKTHSRLRLVRQSKPAQYEAETGGHPGVRAK
jgi:hypothetical protein